MKEAKNELDLTFDDITKNEKKKLNVDLADLIHKNGTVFDLGRELGLDNHAKMIDFYEMVEKNSVQDEKHSKEQPCHGEYYPSKLLDKNKVKAFLKVSLFAAALHICCASAKFLTIISEYGRYLKVKASQELSYDEYKEFELPSILERCINYANVYSNLNRSDYTILGNRKDGKVSEYYVNDPDIRITPKEDQALDIATDLDMRKYKTNKQGDFMIDNSRCVLENGIEYEVIDKIINGDNKYVYLSNINDNKDICIRKEVKKTDDNYLVGLDDEQELKIALGLLLNKNKEEFK